MAVLAGWYCDSNEAARGGTLRAYVWRQRGSYEHMVHTTQCCCCCIFLDEFKRHSRLKSLLFHFEFCRKRDLFVWQRALDYHYFHIWVKYFGIGTFLRVFIYSSELIPTRNRIYGCFQNFGPNLATVYTFICEYVSRFAHS